MNQSVGYAGQAVVLLCSSVLPGRITPQYTIGLPWILSGKQSTCNAEGTGDAGSIGRLGRSPGGGHGNPLQYSCLENPMDRGAW